MPWSCTLGSTRAVVQQAAQQLALPHRIAVHQVPARRQAGCRPPHRLSRASGPAWASASRASKVHITGKDGQVTTVDTTWTVVQDDAGRLRSVVHHPSPAYTGS